VTPPSTVHFGNVSSIGHYFDQDRREHARDARRRHKYVAKYVKPVRTAAAGYRARPRCAAHRGSCRHDNQAATALVLFSNPLEHALIDKSNEASQRRRAERAQDPDRCVDLLKLG
jgi:hypothetical protein